jgi:hypothetical protein
MRWNSFRKYHVWVINTKLDVGLYKWSHWKLIMPSINILLNLNPEESYIRSFQSFEYENRWLGFGRMKWSDENNLKWTTKYRTSENQANLRFNSTEVWSPDWNKCQTDGVPPEIYIQLYHHDNIVPIREGLVIALSKTLATRSIDKVEFELQKLVSIVPEATVSRITRRWQPWWRHTNRLEDMNPTELQEIVERSMRSKIS